MKFPYNLLTLLISLFLLAACNVNQEIETQDNSVSEFMIEDQPEFEHPYDFENFKVTEFFEGTPAPPDFDADPDWLTFVTRITEGAKEGPNFAGNYTIVEWGCGTQCSGGIILNSVTGKILSLPPATNGYDYSLDSYLLIVNPYLPELQDIYGGDIPDYYSTSYYKLEEDELIELKSS